MKRNDEFTGTDTPAAAARVVATLLARDRRLDWREMEFLAASDAFALMGVSRQEFLTILARVLAERPARGSTRRRTAEPMLVAIRDRRLQLLLAALLVYIAEIDRQVPPEEASLVRAAFDQWGITPADLAREMGVPLARSLDALGEGVRAA